MRNGRHFSDFSIAERLVATAWVHERPYTGQTPENIMNDFVVRFGKPSPTSKTLRSLGHKTF